MLWQCLGLALLFCCKRCGIFSLQHKFFRRWVQLKSIRLLLLLSWGLELSYCSGCFACLLPGEIVSGFFSLLLQFVSVPLSNFSITTTRWRNICFCLPH